jgi:hypothetical protein
MAAGQADAAERGFYVYGIIGREQPDVSGVAGVDAGSGVFVVEGDGLGAIVSEVPLAEFGDEALHGHLEDVSWLTAKVRAHEDVLEQAARAAPVLPLRFGTIYRSLDGLRDLLARDRDHLAATLERLAGKREWGVKSVVDRERLEEAVSASDPRAAELAAATEAKPAGTAYLGRKRLERHVDAQAADLAERLGGQAHERLAALADSAVRERAAGLKAAYLVEQTREDDFRRELDEIAREYEHAGIRFELTGPWPPYSFVGEPAR